MTQRRVVVTGLGTISALGQGREAFWQALRQGRAGIGPLTRVDASRLRFQNAAEVRDFRPEDHFDRKQRMLLDRFAQWALVAAHEAIADSGIDWTPDLRQHTA